MFSRSALLERPFVRRFGGAPRGNALPEHTNYADTGCDLYPSCLQCPLPRCRYEEPGGAAAILRQGRDESILRLARNSGLGVDELARSFGVSRRTIFRVLSSAKQCDNPRSTSPAGELLDLVSEFDAEFAAAWRQHAASVNTPALRSMRSECATTTAARVN